MLAKDLLEERLPRGRLRTLLGRLGWGLLGGRDSTKLLRRSINGQSLRLEARSLTYYCDYEIDLFRWIDPRLPADGLFLDIGAHHGMMSLPLLNKSPARKSIMVEASSATCQIIQHHLAANHLEDRTILRHLAISDTDNRSESFVLLGDGTGSSNHLGSLHDGLPEATRSEPVTTIRVDTLVESLGARPDVIKIDIEGWEVKAVRGMIHTLETQRPHVVIGLHYVWIKEVGDDVSELFQILRDFHYEIEHVRAPRQDPRLVEDIVCTPRR